MKKLHFILWMVVLHHFIQPTVFANVTFTKKLEEARIQAAKEGKPFFIHFTAKWCMPCQWMEQHTFQDQNLGTYANTHYLAVKVDIDEKEGIFYKEHYEITILPSLLLFTAQGTLLKRFEETLPAEKLLQILKKHNLPENQDINTTIGDAFVLESPKPRIHVHRPALIPEASTAAYTPTLIMPTRIPENGSIPLPSIPSAPLPNTAYFSIQVGVYTDQSNAVRQVQKLKSKLEETVNIHHKVTNKRIKYKILIGSFPSKREAVHYLEFLKSNNIWGFVKKVSNK